MADINSITNPYAGILSPDENQASIGHGLLSLASGLLAGSGWQPHPVSLGSVIGQAAIPAMQSQQQFSGQMLQAKHLKNQLEMEQMMMPFKRAAIADLMNSGTPSQNPSSTTMDIQGNQFLTNTLPPYLQTNPNAPANASQQVSAQQNMINIPGQGYFTPEKVYRQGKSLTILGMPGGAEMMSLAVAHDPNIAAQMAGATEKAKFPYTAAASFLRYAGRPTVMSPGQVAVPPLAMLPPGMQDVLKGAIGSMNGGQPQSGMTQGGIPQAGMSPQGLPPPIPQPGTPQSNGLSSGGTVPTALGPAPIYKGIGIKEAASEKGLGTYGADIQKTVDNKAAQALEGLMRNQKMIDTLDSGQVSMGPLTGQITFTKNLLTQILPENLRPKGSDPSSTQEYEKYALQGATTVAKQQFGSRITQNEVMLMIRAFPGSTITEKANRAILQFSNIQLQRDVTAQSALQDYKKSGGQLENFPSYFNKNYPLYGFTAPKNPVPDMGNQNISYKNAGNVQGARKYNPVSGKIE